MKFQRTLALCGTALATLVTSPSASAAATAATLPALEKFHRIVFLGDSITYSGQYIDYLDAYLTTRFPEQRWELLDLGLPSETVSGLSEPGHAGGKFPRPDLHERLDRVLAKTKPDLVVACYGMNDGIYHPFSEERFKKYQEGIQRLREKVLATGAKILHVTPPTFDPVPIKAKVLPAGREVYEQPFEGYNQVLDRYSEWLLGQRKLGWDVVDLHRVMNRHLAERRKIEPGYILAKDGVHANATGHWLIAQEILKHWKAPAEVGNAAIDLRHGREPFGVSSNIVVEKTMVDDSLADMAFLLKTRVPMPLDSQWDKTAIETEGVSDKFNLLRLMMTNTHTPQWEFFDGGRLLGSSTADQLAKGVNLTKLPGWNKCNHYRDDELLKLVRQRGRILADAWLNECGHLRPGMKQGLPIAEARNQTLELTGKIRELATPTAYQLGLSNQKSN